LYFITNCSIALREILPLYSINLFMSFNNFNLSEPILKALESQGYHTPTPIQAQSIPIVLEGRDLLGCAQTGTGKTAAFSLPILELLYQQKLKQADHSKAVKALIVTPTRELAIQIGESLTDYGKHTGIKHAVIFGGVSQAAQVNQLKAKVDIIVATPGRLLDLISQGYIFLDKLSIFVLDEADRMLDMGFIHDVKKIIKLLPQRKQSLFFSATMPDPIQQLADTILHNPTKVEVSPVSSTAEKVSQELFYVDQNNKYDLLTHVLKDTSILTALVFTRTKHGADKVVKMLLRHNISAEAIHGNKSQNARQKALSNFKAQTTRVLVATDIAARGIDIDDLAFVVNFEIPNVPETYVHRIGRTGRAGASGVAISFCDVDEVPFIQDVQKLIGFSIPVINDHPFPAIETVPDGKFKSKPRSPREPRRDVSPRTPKSNSSEPRAKFGSNRFGTEKLPTKDNSAKSENREKRFNSSPEQGGQKNISRHSNHSTNPNGVEMTKSNGGGNNHTQATKSSKPYIKDTSFKKNNNNDANAPSQGDGNKKSNSNNKWSWTKSLKLN
jgi:ATP-dependent RNA helicase RhlE